MKKTFFSVLAIAFLDNFGYSLVFILFAPLLLNPQYGFFSAQISQETKNALLGLLIGIFPFFLFFSAPFWGDVGDRWGRKKALVFTILGTALGHVLSALAIWVQSYFFLLVARAIAGVCAGNISICLAAVSDLSEDPRIKAHNFGLLTVWMGVGWILAMPVGGFFSDPSLVSFFSPTLPFIIVTILTLIGYLLLKFWFTETHHTKPHIHFHWMKSIHEIKAALQTAQIRPFLYILFLWSLGWFFTFQWFTALSLERYGATQESASFRLIVLGLGWVIGGVFLNSLLVKKFSSLSLSLFSIAFTALFVLFSSFSSHYFLFSLFFWISAFAAPVSMSNLLNLLSLSSPPSVQGKTMGFAQAFQAVAGVLVPLVGGELATFSIRLIFPVSALLLFLSFLFLVRKKI